MNIYGHLATVTLVLKIGIVPEGFILIEGLLEQVLDGVLPIYSQDKARAVLLLRNLSL